MINTKKTIHGLYVITDQRMISPKRFSAKIRQALEGGVRVMQYRDKSQQHELRWEQAQELVKLCREYNAISIINDDIELTKVVGADGVHIGAEDDDVLYAREQLGENKIIGVSCYADIGLAKKVILESADYVAFGSIFSSSTKPQAPVAGLDVLRGAKNELSVPVVAIGGINLNNMADVVATGVDAISIISGVFANEAVTSSAQQFSTFFHTKD
jgi:thiamine-phosphate pyrophosphorylase